MVPILNLGDKLQLLGKGDDEMLPCQTTKAYNMNLVKEINQEAIVVEG